MNPRRLGALSFGALWAASVTLGLGLLLIYETTPGARGEAPARWPDSSAIRRQPGVATLVMGVHPHCPCTRASLAELALLMARLKGQVRASVLFVSPPGAGDTWAATGLWRSAMEIPGVDAVADFGGREAALFGVETSGHTLLYDRDGVLLFSGGITPSRGHEGDSAGRTAIVSLVEKGRSPRNATAVFGCPLHETPRTADAGVTPCPRQASQ